MALAQYGVAASYFLAAPLATGIQVPSNGTVRVLVRIPCDGLSSEAKCSPNLVRGRTPVGYGRACGGN